VLAEVAELAAPKLNLKTKVKQIIHQPSNERQAAILANTLLYEVPTYLAGCSIGNENRKTKRKKSDGKPPI